MPLTGTFPNQQQSISKLYQPIKRIIHSPSLEFIPGLQSWLTLKKKVIIIHYVNRVKEKSWSSQYNHKIYLIKLKSLLMRIFHKSGSQGSHRTVLREMLNAPPCREESDGNACVSALSHWVRGEWEKEMTGVWVRNTNALMTQLCIFLTSLKYDRIHKWVW